jgi:hypothetical protein
MFGGKSKTATITSKGGSVRPLTIKGGDAVKVTPK